MRKVIYFFCSIAVLFSLTGCQPMAKEYLVVDFRPQPALTYRLVSERGIDLDLDSSGKMKPEEMHEKLEMVISYKPVGSADAYGLTTIEANCLSAKVTRRAKGSSSGDVVNSLTGKSYTFKITPSGKITDFSNMTAIVRELGKKAIVSSGSQGRIKTPDMIADFATLQWYLWAAISSVDQPMKGVQYGQSWTSKQFIPLPVPVGFTRETTYTLAGGLEDGQSAADGEKRVVIESKYEIGEGALENWPKIYTGGFNMKGTFGILRNFRLQTIEGAGKLIFNLDRGVVEKDVQEYKVDLAAAFLLPLANTSPMLSVDQKITVELVDN